MAYLTIFFSHVKKNKEKKYFMSKVCYKSVILFSLNYIFDKTCWQLFPGKGATAH